MVSDGCLDGFWRKGGRCLRAVLKVSVTGQVGADQLIPDRSNGTGQLVTGQAGTGQVGTDQVRTYQVGTCQVITDQVGSS